MFCKACLTYIHGKEKSNVVYTGVSYFCCQSCLRRYLKELTTDKSMYRNMKKLDGSSCLYRCKGCVRFQEFWEFQINKKRNSV